MSSYSLTLSNNGSNTWTPSARRNATVSSGGTSITLPWVENTNAGANTTSKDPRTALEACLRAVTNNFATGTFSGSSYSVEIADNGSGTFTPTVRRDATVASGGTALTLPWVENTNAGANTTTKDLQIAFRALFRAVVNDRAAGN